MSSEGRQIFICPKGHISSYDIWDTESNIDEVTKKRVCSFCHSEVHYVGHVDDTNGESSANFYKKLIMKGSTSKKYYPETDKLVITIVPDIYQISYGQPDEFFNFDTGQKLD